MEKTKTIHQKAWEKIEGKKLSKKEAKELQTSRSNISNDLRSLIFDYQNSLRAEDLKMRDEE